VLCAQIPAPAFPRKRSPGRRHAGFMITKLLHAHNGNSRVSARQAARKFTVVLTVDL